MCREIHFRLGDKTFGLDKNIREITIFCKPKLCVLFVSLGVNLPCLQH